MEKLQEIINILQANNICNKVLKKSSASGGCINDAFKLSTDSGDLFVKVRIYDRIIHSSIIKNRGMIFETKNHLIFFSSFLLSRQIVLEMTMYW